MKAAAPKLKLRPRPKGLPRPKPPKARKPVAVQHKVWTGAKKKLGVSPLQLALPGMGASPL
jgi:hypothetical protein